MYPMQPPSTDLTLEQQFNVAQATVLIEKANLEQTRQLYIDLYKHYLLQKNYYQALVKTSWGLDEPNKRPTEEKRRSEGTDNKAS